MWRGFTQQTGSRRGFSFRGSGAELLRHLKEELAAPSRQDGMDPRRLARLGISLARVDRRRLPISPLRMSRGLRGPTSHLATVQRQKARAATRNNKQAGGRAGEEGWGIGAQQVDARRGQRLLFDCSLKIKTLFQPQTCWEAFQASKKMNMFKMWRIKTRLMVTKLWKLFTMTKKKWWSFVSFVRLINQINIRTSYCRLKFDVLNEQEKKKKPPKKRRTRSSLEHWIDLMLSITVFA